VLVHLRLPVVNVMIAGVQVVFVLYAVIGEYLLKEVDVLEELIQLSPETK